MEDNKTETQKAPTKIDPNELEAAAIAAANSDLGYDPDKLVQHATTTLGLYTPIFSNLLNQLSVNAVRRVTKKLVEWPLGDKPYNATSQKEKEAFAIGTNLLRAKEILIMDTYNRHVINAPKSETSEPLAPVTNNDESKENKNE